MKQLLYTRVNSYFFRGRTNIVTVKRYLNHYKSYFSAVTAVQDVRPEVLTKSILEKTKNINVEKKFSSHPSNSKSLILMDFDVWIYPKFTRSLISLYNYYFVLKDMDNNFTFTEFNRSSITALQVVTSLLSELRFSELEGLLTEECKQEVEKNLNFWPKHKVSILAIDPDKIFKVFPCDIVVSSGENDKVFVEIRVIHHTWLKYSPGFENSDVFQTLFGKKNSNDIIPEAKSNDIYIYCIYNSKFIKEFTKGVTDQWTINAINFQCYSNFIKIIS